MMLWPERDDGGRRAKGRDSCSSSPQPWTANRCHRFLRPLQARIKNLRQAALEATPSIPSTNNKRKSLDSLLDVPSKQIRIKYSGKRPRLSLPNYIAADPECDPSFRTTNPQTSKIAPPTPISPDAIRLSTPLLKRIRKNRMSPSMSPVAHLKPLGETQSLPIQPEDSSRPAPPASLTRDLQQLRRIFSPWQFRQYEGLFHGLDSVLRSTTAQSLTGNKSLLAMCLRRLPHLMDHTQSLEEERLEKLGQKSVIEESSVSYETYTDLESLGGTADGGWDPLRHLLRAQAIKLLSDSMTDGLVPISISRLLIKLCAEWRCFEEAAVLLRSLVSRSYPPPGRLDSCGKRRVLEPILFLLHFGHSHHIKHVVFSLVTQLLKSGQLPAQWLCKRELSPLWLAAFQTLSTKRHCEDATDFVATALHSLSLLASSSTGSLTRRGIVADGAVSVQHECHQAIVSTIGSIAAVSMAVSTQRTHSEKGGWSMGREAIQSRLVFTLETCLARFSTAPRSIYKTLSSPVLLEVAITVSQWTSLDKPSQGQQIPATLRLPQGPVRAGEDVGDGRYDTYSAIAALLCSITQGCSRGSSLAPHKYLIQIFDHLDRRVTAPGSTTNMKRDCAFMLAQNTGDLKDLAFAESLTPTQTLEGAGMGSRTKTPHTVFAGWRWDQGISEWIVRSPVATRPETDTRSTRHGNACSNDKNKLERLQITSPLHDKSKSGQCLVRSRVAYNRSQTLTKRGAWRDQKENMRSAANTKKGEAEDCWKGGIEKRRVGNASRKTRWRVPLASIQAWRDDKLSDDELC